MLLSAESNYANYGGIDDTVGQHYIEVRDGAHFLRILSWWEADDQRRKQTT